MEILGGRKFVITIVCLLFAFVITALNILEPTIFLDFMKYILSAYLVGNVASKAVESMGSKAEPIE